MHVSPDDRLHVGAVPASARGLVLMLHGGAEHGHREVDHRSLAFRRTRWMYDAIADPLRREGVGVALLRFTVKGWQAKPAGSAATDAHSGHADVPPPVADARAALARLRARHEGLPVVLLGHSMGARTAAWVADEPEVVGVVGLAPWLPADDPVDALAGRHLVAAHGRRDRITSPRATAAYLRRAADVAASTRYVDMGPLGHYMIAGVRRWNATAVSESLGLLDRVAGGTVSGVTSPE
jgi:alpha-beta hydrolase superfamily lysophospholipase